MGLNKSALVLKLGFRRNLIIIALRCHPSLAKRVEGGLEGVIALVASGFTLTDGLLTEVLEYTQPGSLSMDRELVMEVFFFKIFPFIRTWN
jgi:hypothetical protein